MRTLRQYSAANFDAQKGTFEEINAGSLQRIADAVERLAAASEKMAANWNALTADRDRYKKWYEEERDRRARDTKRMSAQINGLRGAITRMKRKAEGAAK